MRNEGPLSATWIRYRTLQVPSPQHNSHSLTYMGQEKPEGAFYFPLLVAVRYIGSWFNNGGGGGGP
jgi:hypothetical protein